MGMYQLLKEAGFEELLRGPLVITDLTDFVEGAQVSGSCIAILPGYLVPQARLNRFPTYPENAFNNNYMVFLLRHKPKK